MLLNDGASLKIWTAYLRFLQAQLPEGRFTATWKLVVHYAKVRDLHVR